MALDAAIAALYGSGEEGYVIDMLDTTTTFQERTGLSASTPSGVDGVIGTVLDLSGNNNHMIAPSDAARPILRNPTGSVWRAQGDGSDDGWLCDTISITGTTIYFAIAFQVLSTISFSRIGSAGNTVGGNDFGSNQRSVLLARLAGGASFQTERNASNVNQALANSVDAVFQCGHDGSGGFISKDAGADSTYSASLGSFAISRVSLFRASQGGDFSSAYIYRSLVLDRIPTSGERTSIRTWMQNGIDGIPDGGGPTGHPAVKRMGGVRFARGGGHGVW